MGEKGPAPIRVKATRSIGSIQQPEKGHIPAAAAQAVKAEPFVCNKPIDCPPLRSVPKQKQTEKPSRKKKPDSIGNPAS